MELLLIALATFVTEDLTCVATGALIAQGRLAFASGTAACLLGICAGDLLLFLGGRFARPLAFRFVSADKVAKASDWMSRRGMAAVFLSRFAPGLRLPTYVAAGALRTNAWRFLLYFALAASVWTPLLVGGAALVGGRVVGATRWLPLAFVAAFALRNFRVRRQVIGFVRRKVRWEFWPVWAAYLPLAPYLIYQAVKYRSLTLFTAANPGIPSGGFVGESKAAILANLHGSVARFALIPSALECYTRTRRALDFLSSNGLGFPVVLKPDTGERGSGVKIIRCSYDLESYLSAARTDTIIQEYAPGLEFGVFYVRRPGAATGRVVSITEKRFPELVGDGVSCVRDLILGDERAVCLYRTYLKNTSGDYVPSAGERIRLAELGSHCRGAIFLDGMRYWTPELEAAIDRVSRTHPEFYFGRYDIRARDLDAFQRGEFCVIELNGVSAEATHVYDPAVSLVEAYRVMFRQWRTAFEIGAANRARGFAPMPLGELIRAVWRRSGVRKNVVSGQVGDLPYEA